METYYVSCKEYTTNENSNVRKTKQKKIRGFIKLCYLWQENVNFYIK